LVKNGLLRMAEKLRLESAKKELEKQNRIVQEIERKEAERKARIDKVETDYTNAMQLYNIRCQNRGANAPALIRLSLLIHERDIRRFSPGEWDALIESYGLTQFGKWLNELCPPEKPPVKKEIPNLLEDD
jgi:hypothetical protein